MPKRNFRKLLNRYYIYIMSENNKIKSEINNKNKLKTPTSLK